MKRKIIGVVTYVLLGLIFIIILFSFFCIFISSRGESTGIFGYYPLKVLTGSMEPELPVNSVVIAKKTDASELKTGDIISFISVDPEISGQIVTHRIYSIDSSDGNLFITTKGDKNPLPDTYKVTSGNIVGRVISTSGLYSLIVKFIENKWLYITFILIPLIITSMFSMREFIKALKDDTEKSGDESDEEKINT